MLTRKHFEAVALILKDNRGPYKQGVINKMSEDFADYFEGESHIFDRERFIQATKEDRQ
jgi:hypothetical protein